MSTTISDQLHAVRALIEDEARWCTGWFALDKDGKELCDNAGASEEAARWCVLGACNKVHVSDRAKALLRRVSHRDYGMLPDTLNDALGHVAVMQLLDAAIAEAESKSC